jgi:hypothetical protein
MYELISSQIHELRKIENQILVLFNSITSKKINDDELSRGTIELHKSFAFGPLCAQLSFENNETFLCSPRSSKISILVEHVDGIGSRGPANIFGSEWSDDDIAIPCDDPILSEPYFASFLGTKVVAVETIHVRETGRRGMRANERGLQFTNEAGRQFIIGYGIGKPGTRGGMNILKPDELDPGLRPRMTITKI